MSVIKICSSHLSLQNPLCEILKVHNLQLVTIDVLPCFSVDKKTVTFDVHSQRPQTGGKSTLYTADGTTSVDDAVTVTSGKEPSVMSASSHTSQTFSSFISLKPTEQVRLNLG